MPNPTEPTQLRTVADGKDHPAANAETIFPFPKGSLSENNIVKSGKVLRSSGGVELFAFDPKGTHHSISAMYDGYVSDGWESIDWVADTEQGYVANTKNDPNVWVLTLDKKMVFTAGTSTTNSSQDSPVMGKKWNVGVVVYVAWNDLEHKKTRAFSYPEGLTGGQVKAGDIIGSFDKDTKLIEVYFFPNPQDPPEYKVGDDPPGPQYNTRTDQQPGEAHDAVNWAINNSQQVEGTQPDAATGDNQTPGQIATAAAFSTYFQMPSIMETQEAQALTGQRSLLNDKPLLPFVEQIAAGSLRSFMSMPNGDFYAFYPDYFGGLGKTAYWQISDMEIIDGKIDLSDDALATHVFVVGDTEPTGDNPLAFGTIDMIDRINTAGVVNVFNAFMADFLNGPSDNASSGMGSDKPSLKNKADAIKFLSKYGARPHYEESPAIRSPIYETFVAYQRFCLLWAKQFKTTFEFTFMPELYPGGIVEFKDHGLQCYIERVVHSGSYESGFRTTAELSAPSASRDNSGNAHDPNKSWVHSGMIRAWEAVKNPNAPKDAYNGAD